MFPELFKIPGLGLTIWAYGVVLDAGIIASVWLVGQLGARDGLPKKQIYSVLVFAGPVAFIGAQLLGIVDWHEAASHWQRFLSLGRPHASGASFDALLVMLPVSAVLMRAYALPCWKGLDALAPGVALASAVSRLGCLAAGCCWGRPTDSWIGMRFTERAHELTGVPIGEALVPTQLLSAGAGFLILGVLLLLRKHRAFNGQIILAYLMLYSVACFAIGFWRDDPHGQTLGLSTSQFISTIVFPLASIVYLWLHEKNTLTGDVYEGLNRSLSMKS
jgi:phosphatidylglycerol:prolipoprotein diacylglycerol transferase